MQLSFKHHTADGVSGNVELVLQLHLQADARYQALLKFADLPLMQVGVNGDPLALLESMIFIARSMLAEPGANLYWNDGHSNIGHPWQDPDWPVVRDVAQQFAHDIDSLADPARCWQLGAVQNQGQITLHPPQQRGTSFFCRLDCPAPHLIAGESSLHALQLALELAQKLAQAAVHTHAAAMLRAQTASPFANAGADGWVLDFVDAQQVRHQLQIAPPQFDGRQVSADLRCDGALLACATAFDLRHLLCALPTRIYHCLQQHFPACHWPSGDPCTQAQAVSAQIQAGAASLAD